MALPRSFLNYRNFDLAFTRILRSGNKDYKRFYRHQFSAYNLALEHNLRDLIEDIRHGTFEPEKVTIIYQPKKSGVLRPLTILSLRDLIVYQALANFLAASFAEVQDRYANSRSFGALFAGKASPFFFRSWKNSYSAYNEAIVDAYKAGNVYIADFDLVSFYELIDHELLKTRLSARVGNTEFLDLLFRCLRGWTNKASGSHIGHGIPQGPEPSAFIAECFLFDFDRVKFSKAKYLRYVDDIKLMSREEVPIRRALVKLDLASKRLGLVPQAQKIECRKVRSIKEVLKTIPSALGQAGERDLKKKATQRTLLAAFHKSLKKEGRSWTIDDVTRFKYALNRLKPRKDVLRRITPFLSTRPELSWVLANYFKKFPKNKQAADALLLALRRDPTYDAAAANYVDAMDLCEPSTNYTQYRRVIQTTVRRSEEKSILLPEAVSSFRGRRAAIPQAMRLIEQQPDPRVKGLLIHKLFGDHPTAPFNSTQCVPLLEKLTECEDSDLARYAASMLLGYWPWFTPTTWRPSAAANRSVALLVMGLGLRKRAPKKRGVLETYFQERRSIGMAINWRKALGKDYRAVEAKCLRLQQLMVGDPSVRVMILDTFNESLIQAFSTRHPSLKVDYASCVRQGKAVPDYGQWLYHKNALVKVLPRCTPWLLNVHKARVKVDLAHAKDQKTGVHTRPIGFDRAGALFKQAQVAWAELIREWIKIL